MTVQKDLVAGRYDRAFALYDQVGPKTVSRFGERLLCHPETRTYESDEGEAYERH
jgi:hypothetical protein